MQQVTWQAKESREKRNQLRERQSENTGEKPDKKPSLTMERKFVFPMSQHHVSERKHNTQKPAFFDIHILTFPCSLPRCCKKLLI
jgi:hypothetical protein